MVLPGVQALLGFQLIAVFNQRFETLLTPSERILHLVSFLCVALAIGLLMTPAAYHRQVCPDALSQRFADLSSRLITIALAPLAVAIGIDAYIVGRIILGDVGTSAGIGITLGAALVGLWFACPQIARARRKNRR